jgi:hypothetical protein
MACRANDFARGLLLDPRVDCPSAWRFLGVGVLFSSARAGFLFPHPQANRLLSSVVVGTQAENCVDVPTTTSARSRPSFTWNEYKLYQVVLKRP